MAAIMTTMTAAAATWAGTRENVAAVRAWTQEWLRGRTNGHRRARAGYVVRPEDRLSDTVVADVVLVLSELVTNAIDHSRSGAPEGTFRVRLYRGTELLIVEVLDQGGEGAPTLHNAAAATEQCPDDLPGLDALLAVRGRGLALVDHYAERWWTTSTELGRSVMAEIRIR